MVAQLVKNRPAMQEILFRFLDWDRLPTPAFLDFPGAQMVKNPPAIQETWVQTLGWKDPLKKGKAAYSSILAWRIPWTQEPGRPLCPWITKILTRLSDFHFHFSFKDCWHMKVDWLRWNNYFPKDQWIIIQYPAWMKISSKMQATAMGFNGKEQ